MDIKTSVTKSNGKWTVSWQTLSPKTKKYLHQTASGFDNKKEADTFSKDKERVEMIKKNFEKTIAEQEQTWKDESLTPAQKAFDVKTLKDANQMLADMKKQAAQNKDSKKAKDFKDSIAELEKTIEDIKAEQSASESKKNENFTDEMNQFIDSAKKDAEDQDDSEGAIGRADFTDNESGDSVVLNFIQRDGTYDLTIGEDEVLSGATRDKVVKILTPIFKAGNAIQEKLSKKIKKLAEEFNPNGCGSDGTLEEKDNQAHIMYQDQIKANGAKLAPLEKKSSDLFAQSKAKGISQEKRQALNKKRFEINNQIQAIKDHNDDLHKKVKSAKKSESMEEEKPKVGDIVKYSDGDWKIDKIEHNYFKLSPMFKSNKSGKTLAGDHKFKRDGKKWTAVSESLAATVKRLAESEGSEEAGFDLTDMPVKDWEELFQDFGFKPEAGKVIKKFPNEKNSSYYWVWQNQGNEIRTSSNPFTGKPSNPDHQDQYDKGYSGSIGLKGHATDVEHIYNFISDKGDWKDRSFGKARYV